jgi:hypothetical protein
MTQTDLPTSVPDPMRRRVTLAPLTVAALLLGLALQMREGMYRPGDPASRAAMALMAVGFLGVIAAVALPLLCPAWGLGGAGGSGGRLPVTLLALALCLQVVLLATTNPGTVLNLAPGRESPFADPGVLVHFHFAVLLAGLVVLSSVPRGGLPAAAAWPVVLALFLTLGAWVIHRSPQPHIDVFVFQQESSRALLAGRNPYTITFPNIYGSAHNYVYGPALMRGERLDFGFPYQPLSLFLALPGYLLAGDYRYAQLAAVGVSALLMVLMGRGDARRLSLLAMALFLFTPRGFLVLEMGWTEPFVVLGLAATVYCALHRPRWLPVALGLLFATKQYTVLIAPLTVLLLPRPLPWRAWGRLLLGAGLVAAAVSLPLIMLNVPAYIHSAVTLQFHQPFRRDALSFLAWVYGRWHVQLPDALALAAVAPAIALALWRSPRTPAGFAASVALAYYAFLAFNKQAFCNYYFFVIGALCCALAASALHAQPQAPVAPRGRIVPG